MKYNLINILVKSPYLTILFGFVFHLFLINKSFSQTKIELNENWKFRQVGKDSWHKASVPGTVHQDLLANNIIEDPFYGLNEFDVQWIENEEWEYTTSFDLSKEILSHDHKELYFKGLDTYADVYLNDKLILEANNMFRTWSVTCNPFLKEGKNELRIHFKSPVTIGLEKLKQLGFLIPVQNEQAPKGKQTSVFTRKAAYHYGWDWGPRLVTSGIWQPIYIKAWSTAKINDLYLKQENLSNESATYTAQLEIQSIKNCKGKIEFSIDGKKLQEKTVKLKKGLNIISHNLAISSPELWWPAGAGKQNIYRVNTSLFVDDKEVDTKQSKLGIRSLKIIQKPDSLGKSFYVEINGVPIFMKGANYIPGDNLIPRVDTAKYQRVINEALAANMNILRIWGGAIYETDYFYELCLEKGIMLYQDFMFACSMYPGDQSMIENITLEAEEQVKRLRNYPNIILWAGNNEILNGWHEWDFQNRFGYNDQQKDTLWSYYKEIFYNVLPEVVEKYDPEKLYWSCSPQSAPGKLQNPFSGDQHFWSVWFGEKPFSAYEEQPGRFISEYGFQSYPSINTLKKISQTKDLEWDSELLLKRQRSPMEWLGKGINGNHMINRYMIKEFKKPKDFESYVYISQLLHAQALKTASEAHRRNKPYTMGTLYWQINDCWPTISWSTIDYYGNWKAGHYQIKDSYKDLLVSLTEEEGQLNTYVVSDRLINTSAMLKITVFDFEGNATYNDSIQLNIPANSSKIYSEHTISELLKDKVKEEVYIYVSLEENQTKVAENYYFFVPHKSLLLPKPKVKTKITGEDNWFTVSVSTDKFAKNIYIYFDGYDANMSDNFFDLKAGTEKSIRFKSTESVTVEDLKKKLKVLTVADTY